MTTGTKVPHANPPTSGRSSSAFQVNRGSALAHSDLPLPPPGPSPLGLAAPCCPGPCASPGGSCHHAPSEGRELLLLLLLLTGCLEVVPVVVAAGGSGLRPQGSGRLGSRSAWGHSRAARHQRGSAGAAYTSVDQRGHVGPVVGTLVPLHPSSMVTLCALAAFSCCYVSVPVAGVMT